MAAQSAGLLLYRMRDNQVEVLLCHPGGPFYARKDDGVWTIPKGEFAPSEDPFQAALREFQEETGQTADGEFIKLKPIAQEGGKIVHSWAVEAEFDTTRVKSNTFSLEWPPRSGHQQEFPEIDRAEWLDLETARRKILKAQLPLIDQLESLGG